MSRSTVFKPNKTQTLRLPEAVAQPEHAKQVDNIVIGNARLILPTGESWADFFSGPRLDKDFLANRKQPRI